MNEQNGSCEKDKDTNNNTILEQKSLHNAPSKAEKKEGILITTAKGVTILSKLNPNAPEFYPASYKPLARKNQCSEFSLQTETAYSIPIKQRFPDPSTATTTTITTTNPKSIPGEALLSPTQPRKPLISTTINGKLEFSASGKGEPDGNHAASLLLNKETKIIQLDRICYHDILPDTVIKHPETVERTMGILRVDEVLNIQDTIEKAEVNYGDQNSKDITVAVNAEIPIKIKKSKGTIVSDPAVLNSLPFNEEHEKNAGSKTLYTKSTLLQLCPSIFKENLLQRGELLSSDNMEYPKHERQYDLNPKVEEFKGALHEGNHSDAKQITSPSHNDNAGVNNQNRQDQHPGVLEYVVEQPVKVSSPSASLPANEKERNSEPLNSTKPMETTTGLIKDYLDPGISSVSNNSSSTSLGNCLKGSRIAKPIKSSNESGSMTARLGAKALASLAMKSTRVETVNKVAAKKTGVPVPITTTSSSVRRATNSPTKGLTSALKSAAGTSVVKSGVMKSKELTTKTTTTGTKRTLLSTTRTRIGGGASTTTNTARSTIPVTSRSHGNPSSSSSTTSNLSNNSIRTMGSGYYQSKTSSTGANRGSITSRIGSALSSAGSKRIGEGIPKMMTARTSSLKHGATSNNRTSPSTSSLSSSGKVTSIR